MKIYLASSWRMKRVVEVVAEKLREWDHEVDAFCEPREGRYTFDARELADLDGNPESIDAIRMCESEQGRQAFAEDRRWIDWADAIVLILPSGRSAHLEAGYAVGRGKGLFVFGEFPGGEWEVMYGFADRLVRMFEPGGDAAWSQLREALDQFVTSRVKFRRWLSSIMSLEAE